MMPARTAAGLAALTLLLGGQSAWAQDSDWSLVAIYDGASVGALQQAMKDEEGNELPPEEFVWRADSAVEQACGRPKAPIGMGGQMDAEVMASGGAPYLTVLLSGPAGERLDTENLRVYLGAAAEPFPLAPAVLPRTVMVDVNVEALADAEANKVAEQLRSQLTVQLCLEHQVGRGWRGLTAEGDGGLRQMRSAFLLDTVSGADDRRLFVGQGIPAPALLGPPRWGASWVLEMSQASSAEGPQLTAGDIFGFRAPSLASVNTATSWPSDGMELAVGGVDCPGCSWVAQPNEGILRLELNVGSGNDPWLSARYRVGDDPAAEWRNWRDGARVKPTLDAEALGTGRASPTLVDVLGEMPYEYPRFLAATGEGDTVAERSLAVLMIPNWQLVNGIEWMSALARGGSYDPLTPLPEQVVDGVGWILENPGNLHVQVVDRGPVAQEVDYPDLVSVVEASAVGPWGATPGFWATGSPIAMPAVAGPDVRQQGAAMRTFPATYTLLSAFICLIFLVPGLARISNLWTARPKERAWGWPLSWGEESALEGKGGGKDEKKKEGGGGGEGGGSYGSGTPGAGADAGGAAPAAS